jgi:hypothetical protein
MRLPAASVLAVAQQRASALRSSTFSELSALPPVRSEVAVIDGCDLKITVYRDPLPDGRLRVVVQSYLDRLFGIGTMTADGFIIAPDNSLSELPEKMLYEFC